MKGQIFKIHSDFYYVDTAQGTYECKIREVLKKRKDAIVVGDFVELEQLNENSKQAFVSKVLPRKSFIPRPKVANVNQVIIVCALKEPELDFEQLNRYLSFCEYYNLHPVLCFNKNDLEGEEEIIAKIKKIYEPLNYDIIFTSALEGNGIQDFKALLKDRTTVLCGSSGVGKSSITNALQENVQMETGEISKKLKRGKHTTRHSQVIPVGHDTYLMDTPGFSSLYLTDIEEQELKDYFPEFRRYEEKCRFQGCRHIHEPDCGVKAALAEHKISQLRYEDYLGLYNELKEKRRF